MMAADGMVAGNGATEYGRNAARCDHGQRQRARHRVVGGHRRFPKPQKTIIQYILKLV